jgi:hypothetical protein
VSATPSLPHSLTLPPSLLTPSLQRSLALSTRVSACAPGPPQPLVSFPPLFQSAALYRTRTEHVPDTGTRRICFPQFFLCLSLTVSRSASHSLTHSPHSLPHSFTLSLSLYWSPVPP